MTAHVPLPRITMKQPIYNFWQWTYRRLLQPRSVDEDARRRELIFNTIVVALIGIACIALTSSILNHLSGTAVGSNSIVNNGVFLLLMIGLHTLSRRGFVKTAIAILLILLLLIPLELIMSWSFELPQAILMTAMIIVVAGILLSARAALLTTLLISAGLVLIAQAQVHGSIAVNTSWLNRHLEIGDAIGYMVIFWIIGLISWLANRQIASSLSRARRSERALARERDSLEVKVAKRTRQLEQAQLMRTMELQRFAEFGRISAGLLHDVASPLTAASLNLEQAGKQPRSREVRQALSNLRHLERYVESARKQLQHESAEQEFSVRLEIVQVIDVLAHQARSLHVSVRTKMSDNYVLYGDVAKFSQIMANLIMNAIEAYGGSDAAITRDVSVEVSEEPGHIVIVVRDHGKGIPKAELSKLFKPFYSTKARHGRGLGIGLTMVKQYVEQDFAGSITVTSSPQQGTCFTLKFVRREAD